MLVDLVQVWTRDGLRLDGANPTLLTAYGGFGATLGPSYHADVLDWLESRRQSAGG